MKRQCMYANNTSRAQPSPAQPSPAQPSPAQPSTAQPSTAQHSTAQHSYTSCQDSSSSLHTISRLQHLSCCWQSTHLFCRWLMNFSKASLSALLNCSFFWKAWLSTVSSCTFISSRADTMSLSCKALHCFCFTWILYAQCPAVPSSLTELTPCPCPARRYTFFAYLDPVCTVSSCTFISNRAETRSLSCKA